LCKPRSLIRAATRRRSLCWLSPGKRRLENQTGKKSFARQRKGAERTKQYLALKKRGNPQTEKASRIQGAIGKVTLQRVGRKHGKTEKKEAFIKPSRIHREGPKENLSKGSYHEEEWTSKNRGEERGEKSRGKRPGKSMGNASPTDEGEARKIHHHLEDTKEQNKSLCRTTTGGSRPKDHLTERTKKAEAGAAFRRSIASIDFLTRNLLGKQVARGQKQVGKTGSTDLKRRTLHVSSKSGTDWFVAKPQRFPS